MGQFTKEKDSVAQLVERLTPDQKVACSSHVGVIFRRSFPPLKFFSFAYAKYFEILKLLTKKLEEKKAESPRLGSNEMSKKMSFILNLKVLKFLKYNRFVAVASNCGRL